jgi:prepilin-type N-terminal cleavage/methylation domain-containing protein
MSRRPRSGFTLVELMLVMTILAVALVAMGDTVLTVNRLGPVNEEDQSGRPPDDVCEPRACDESR